MPAIFYSSLDPAGVNIAAELKENFGFQNEGIREIKGRGFGAWRYKNVELTELETPLVAADYLSDYFESDLFVFASRHRSESAKPCLTVHASGNFGKAEFGGNAGELALTSAFALKAGFAALKKRHGEVFREATHHGPTSLKVPSIWMEIGSSEKEWKDETLGQNVAEAIAEVCGGVKKSGKVALGFGGTHYCPAFGPLEEYAFSHIAPKYALDFVDDKMFGQMVAKTAEKVECVVMDKKGCTREQKEKISGFASAAGLPAVLA